tara:strand:+ start:124 stop:252 length:129 start_codon:yes stop_codon:yes gene_type:complete
MKKSGFALNLPQAKLNVRSIENWFVPFAYCSVKPNKNQIKNT